MPDRLRHRPMQPSSYRAVARKVRRMADRIESMADAETPRERASLTRMINILSRYTTHVSRRHRLRNTPDG